MPRSDSRPVFADPKTDVIFKRIFGQPSHKQILITFLNDILMLKGKHRIVDVTYLNPEQVPKVSKYKLSIVDVKCKDASGTQYIVEMQVSETDGFENRLMYNASKAFVGQLKKGDNYPKLNDVISIAICDFELWPASEVPMVSRWQMCEEQTGLKGFGQIRHVVMELPKYAAGEHPESHIDKWAYFFRATDHLRNVPKELSEKVYEEALEITRIANMSEEEYDAYEQAKMAEQDARGQLSHAEKKGFQEGIEKGKVLGVREGLQKGKELGIQEGLEKGKIEGIRSILYLLLSSRSMIVSHDERVRIDAEINPDVLSRWLLQAATASTVTEALC